MRHIFVLAAVAALLTACAASEQIAGDPNTASDVQATGFARDIALVRPWTAYRTFHFDSTTAEISASDLPKVNEIVEYLKMHPALDVAIDGTLNVPSASEADRALASRRAAAVRRALMDAGGGIASYRIISGDFADAELRRAGQVQVLVGPRTGSSRVVL